MWRRSRGNQGKKRIAGIKKNKMNDQNFFIFKNRGLNGNQLKWLAMLTMMIDHTGAVLFPQYRILRIIGRMAFPIYCFLLVQGYFHTRNVWKYGVRLVVFAFISEPCFDRAFFGKWYEPAYQNIFWTLALGLLLMELCSRGEKKEWNLTPVFLVLTVLAAWYWNTDYSWSGVLLIYCFYRAYKLGGKKEKLIQLASQCFFHLLCWGGIQRYGIFSTLLLWLYNQKPGSRKGKYLYYGIYPIHLLLLCWLRKTI